MTLPWWPSIDEVLEIHDESIRLFGGIEGVRDPGLLLSAMSRPFAGYGGVEAFPTDLEKLCCMSFGIVSNHPFADGNKRTGAALLGAILSSNGMSLCLLPGELSSEFLAIAAGVESLDGFIAWTRSHLA